MTHIVPILLLLLFVKEAHADFAKQVTILVALRQLLQNVILQHTPARLVTMIHNALVFLRPHTVIQVFAEAVELAIMLVAIQ